MRSSARLKLLSLCFLLLFIVSFALCACQREQKDESLRVISELGIELPPEFQEFDSEGSFQVAYRTSDAVVGIVRLSFDVAAGEGILTTLDSFGFAKYYRGEIDRTDAEIRTSGDLVWFTYTDIAESGREHLYMPTFFATPYSYFIITFITPTEGSAWRESDFLDIAATVRLVGEF